MVGSGRQIWRHLWFTVFCILFCATSSMSSILSNILTNKTAISSQDMMQSLSQAKQIALEHCQKTFKWERWNCPETFFTKDVQQPSTRETAYVKAIMAAGIIHTLTKNCSRGEIEGCGCDPTKGGQSKPKILGRTIDQAEFNRTELKPGTPLQWSWGGCSDYTKFGTQIAKDFVAPETAIHTHNNKIGADVLKEAMIRRCMCHGVSGSCTIQTCWMQVAPFAAIAQKLKEKFKKAVRIHIESENEFGDKAVLDFEKNLLYSEDSPNYCKPNNASGWKGTKGRSCSRNKLATLAEKRSCRTVCRSCGYRIRKQTKMVHMRCNCKFQYCCTVQCETCEKVLEEFTCL